MRYGISPLGQMPSSCTMQPWAPVHHGMGQCIRVGMPQEAMWAFTSWI